ncbi:MAG: septum formation initiator family protein [Armatimonadota bacterium]|nr:septum formation initiator family protein [Armatimonadota bacterium]MDR5696672.1 septum formation initiator family protein [Armatimonadota bacterium]
MGRPVAVAAIFLLPLLGHVWLEATAAQNGYRIRQLRSEIAALTKQNAHLDSQAAALRSPDRIERLATGRLGMRAPNGRELAAVAVSPQALWPSAPVVAAERSLWQRLAAVFQQQPASAQERGR